MRNPNELCAPLKIEPLDRGALCKLHLSDRRYHGSSPLQRPVAITLSGEAFEATFCATFEDLAAIRDFCAKAMAAIEEQAEEAA